jgi:hypothetical protein
MPDEELYEEHDNDFLKPAFDKRKKRMKRH